MTEDAESVPSKEGRARSHLEVLAPPGAAQDLFTADPARSVLVFLRTEEKALFVEGARAARAPVTTGELTGPSVDGERRAGEGARSPGRMVLR